MVAALQEQFPSHTHDLSQPTGKLSSDKITGPIDANTLEGHPAGDFALSTHTHDYSDITNPQSILTEADIIALIKSHALGAPDYDSGWQTIAQGQVLTFTHNLGTMNLIVYVLGKHMYGGFIHQDGYGGLQVQEYGHGLDWQANLSIINVRRWYNDLSWKQVRVLIWKLP